MGFWARKGGRAKKTRDGMGWDGMGRMWYVEEVSQVHFRG